MEYAVYKVFWGENGRRMGSFVNMFASYEEAQTSARERDGEYEVVGLMTREITEEDEHMWNTIIFDEKDGFEPVGEPGDTNSI